MIEAYFYKYTDELFPVHELFRVCYSSRLYKWMAFTHRYWKKVYNF